MKFSVFTKHWKDKSAGELAQFVKNIGFDAVEYPVRPGYEVTPENASVQLPKLVNTFKDFGVSVESVASITNEAMFEACALAKVPIIRIMYNFDLAKGYKASVSEVKKDIESYLPFCEKYKVKVAVQQHYGPMIQNCTQLACILKDYSTEWIGGIWDSAHSALAGEEPEFAIEEISDRLFMVNFKNVFYKRVNGPESLTGKWNYYFTAGNQGLASWERCTSYLKKVNYDGIVCLTAEYTNEADTDRLIKIDIDYIKTLLGK